MRKLTVYFFFLFTSTGLFAQENLNLDIINKIKEEGTQKFQSDGHCFSAYRCKWPKARRITGLLPKR